MTNKIPYWELEDELTDTAVKSKNVKYVGCDWIHIDGKDRLILDIHFKDDIEIEWEEDVNQETE